MKQVINNIISILNIKTLFVSGLSVVSTYLYINYEIHAKFPDLLIGMAIVFPIVFSISSAFSRREFALQKYSDFKGHLISIYFAFRDWPTIGEDANKLRVKAREDVRAILTLFFEMIKSEKNWHKNEKRLYQLFNDLSCKISELRKANVQSGEISRVNQYISKIIIAFDSLRTIYIYRTPKSLRAFSRLFIFSFPILYAPYFASISQDFNANLTYVMPVLYSFILISLNTIQENLENPFDAKGGDVVFDLEEEMVALQN